MYYHIFLILAVFAYALASGLFLHAFPAAGKRRLPRQAGFALYLVAAVCVTIAGAGSWFMDSYYSQNSGLVLIAVISWITVISYLRGLQLMGLFTAPLATLILLFLALTYPGSEHLGSPPGPVATVHIALAILGEACGVTAFAIALLYLFQQRALKKKELGFINAATPSLDRLDRSLIISLWCGFTCFSLALLTGAIYTQFIIPNPVPGLALKVVWALAVWAWYLATLLARNFFGQSGGMVSRMSVAGFLLLAVSFFGLLQIGGES